MMEENLRVEEFAKRVGYRPSTVRKKLFQRQIKYFKCGRIVVIPSSEVQRLLGKVFEPVVATDGGAK